MIDSIRAYQIFPFDCSFQSDPYKYNMLPPLPAQRNLTPPPTLYPQQPVTVSENYSLPRFALNGSSEISSTARSRRSDINVWWGWVFDSWYMSQQQSVFFIFIFWVLDRLSIMKKKFSIFSCWFRLETVTLILSCLQASSLYCYSVWIRMYNDWFVQADNTRQFFQMKCALYLFLIYGPVILKFTT